MSAGDSGRRRLERLRVSEAECEARLARIRRDIVAIEAGIAGEERIASLLDQLGPEWRVLHDRRKGPRSPANIDHIAIGPTGVYVIDAKNWTGRLWIGDKGVICGRIPRADDERALAELRDLVARELSVFGFPVAVYGVVALANEATATETIVHDGIAYVPPAHLVRGLQTRDPVLGPEQTYRLWELLDDLHPPRAAATTVTNRSYGRPVLPTRVAPAQARSGKWKPPPRKGLRIAVAVVAGFFAIGAIETAAQHLSKSLTAVSNVTQPSPRPTAQPVLSHIAKGSASVTKSKARRHQHHKGVRRP